MGHPVPSSAKFTWQPFASSLLLNRSPKRSKCGRMMIVYLTNSSLQSTSLSRLELGLRRLPSSTGSPVSVKCVQCFRNGALVRDGEHPHPAAQNARRVDGVERLSRR